MQEDAKVSELIDADSGWWNTSLIHKIFNPVEAASICGLALSPHGQPDQLIWQGNPSGTYTVRSAYHLELERRIRQTRESSTPHTASGVWRKIWRLGIPGVVCTFLWRLCTNSLPTKVNLLKKNIVQDCLCPMCGIMVESSGHIIWDCDSSTAVRMDCPRKIQKLSNSVEDGLGWFASLMEKLDEDDLCLVSVLARSIWLRRNAVVFGGQPSSPAFLVQRAIASLDEFKQAQTEGLAAFPSILVQFHWKKPPAGIIKVNWDSALDLSSIVMGVGALARDERGGFVAAFCTIVTFVTDPTIAEAVVAWKTIEFCCAQGYSCLILEGDSLEVVQGLKRVGPS